MVNPIHDVVSSTGINCCLDMTARRESQKYRQRTNRSLIIEFPPLRSIVRFDLN